MPSTLNRSRSSAEEIGLIDSRNSGVGMPMLLIARMEATAYRLLPTRFGFWEAKDLSCDIL